jgi:hypothetical protein
MWESALTAIYYFQKGWIIQSLSGISTVVCFFLKEKEKSDGSFQKFGYFDVLITNCLFLLQKN